MDIYKRIYELENEIAALPQGSINMKKIYGKEQPYLQWTENGKSKSKYIKKNEREEIFAGVERRKQLQEELKELKQHSSIDPSKSTDFETSVIIGERLLALTKGVKNWGKRDCFRQLQAYLNSEETDRVCLVFGLRRTGKTTMLRQAVLGMTPSQSAKSAYIKAKGSDTMAAMNRDLGKLLDLGYEYVFIDEVTLMPDFIDSAALFSDIYAAQGMKIVLSGTDSLGFWFALHQELYDRAVTIHTTFHSVNIVVYSVSTVLTSIFAMAAHFVQENWILMIKTLFQRMLRSVMTNPHGVISIPQSVKISSTP